MARIAGVELNDNWRIEYALTRIMGVGWALSKSLLKDLKIDESKRVSKLTLDELAKIAGKLEGQTIEGELARFVRGNISRLQATGSYRGLRHSKGLPARGQRTRRNARTKRGKRKTVGAFKKEALVKSQPTKEVKGKE